MPRRKKDQIDDQLYEATPEQAPDEYWEKESWSNAFNKIGGICWNRKQQGQS